MDNGMVTRVVRNTLVIFSGQILGRLLDLWATLLIANAYGEIGYGRFSFAIAFVGYFAILTDLGFNMVFVKALVRQKKRNEILLGSMLLVKMVLLAISIGLAITLIFLSNYPLETRQLVWIMAIALIISPKFPSIRLVYEQVFQARLQMEIPALLKCLDGVLLVGLVYCMINFGQPLQSVMVAYVCSNIPGLILIMVVVGRMIRPVARIDFPQMIALLKQGIPVTLLGIFATLIARIDVLFLSLWRSEIEIGYYSAAYRLTEALRIFPTAMMLSLYPLIVSVTSKDKSPADVITSGLKPLLIIIVPICIGTTVWADEIVLFFYSSAFLPAGQSLELLIWTELGFIFTVVFSQTLIALDHRRSVVIVSGVMFLINLTLNFVLIPRWGYLGATMGTVATEMVGIIGYGIYIRRLTGWRFGHNIRPLLPAFGCLGLWIWLAGSYSIGVGMAGSVIVYAGGLWLTRGMTSDELSFLTRMFIRKHDAEYKV